MILAMKINDLYLKAAFCCMACDGNIAQEEVELLTSLMSGSDLFDGIDVQDSIDKYVSAINTEGQGFLNNFMTEISSFDIDADQALNIISLAIKTIEADNNIEYSEISFFKKIRKCLNISDEQILEKFPDKEDYLLPDIEVENPFDFHVSFNQIVLN